MNTSQKQNVEGIKHVAEQIQDDAVLGVPRPPSGLMTQQKGSQDPKEQLHSQLQFSTVKGHRLKSANGKDSWGKVQEKADTGFQEFQWRCMEMCLIFPVKICDNTCSVLPTREAHLILSVQGFYWGLVMQYPHLVMWCPNDWALLLRLQPSPVHLTKTNIHHQFVRINLSNQTGILWPKASVLQSHLSGISTQLSVRIQSWSNFEDKHFFEICRA